MDRKKYNNSNAGMTLLEVIVAVSIFSITAIVLLQSFVTSNRINKKSNTYGSNYCGTEYYGGD